MLELGAETAMHVAKAQDDSVEGLVTQWKDEGIDTYTFSDAELASLTDSMKLVGQDWLERINADGAEAVLENYRALTSK